MDAELSLIKLTVFVTEDDRVGHHGTWHALLERAREDGMAGATVWRGIEGFGRRGYLRSSRFIDAAQGMPLAVELIDEPDRIAAFLPVVRRLAPGALVVKEQVRVFARRDNRQPGLDDPGPPSAAEKNP